MHVDDIVTFLLTKLSESEKSLDAEEKDECYDDVDVFEEGLGVEGCFLRFGWLGSDEILG